MKNQNEAEVKPAKPARIPFIQVRYLKHCAEVNDIKLTVHDRDGMTCIHMRDFEFVTFESALNFIKQASRSIVHPSSDLEVLS